MSWKHWPIVEEVGSHLWGRVGGYLFMRAHKHLATLNNGFASKSHYVNLFPGEEISSGWLMAIVFQLGGWEDYSLTFHTQLRFQVMTDYTVEPLAGDSEFLQCRASEFGVLVSVDQSECLERSLYNILVVRRIHILIHYWRQRTPSTTWL